MTGKHPPTQEDDIAPNMVYIVVHQRWPNITLQH